MVWVIVGAGTLLVVVGALVAVGRVTDELEHTVAPALLRVGEAVIVVAEALPFEVAATLSHGDVERVISWVLDWFDQAGLASEFGEELGGDWVGDQTVAIDEVAACDYAVGRGLEIKPPIDAVHVTVVVDDFMRYLRDIGAIADEVR